jgi:calcineurin-like phosphoesterase family protein
MKPVPGAVLLFFAAGFSSAQHGGSWRFVVGGDSRNCGDVVMPEVAAGARDAGAAFYWHLGDFRAIYDFDQDFAAARRAENRPLTIADYQKSAWQDFLDNQIAPFGALPVYLAMGNHETIVPKSRPEYLVQFADWLDAPPIMRQRLADDAHDRRLKTYYHWIERGIDFVTLDNASPDQFDDEQLHWLEGVLARASADRSILAVVVGMHAALPDSVVATHSMSDFPQGVESGRRVYADLLAARAAGKNVYILASHSHFYMSNIFETSYWKSHGGVLPGWIIGTTGAVRYALPPGAEKTGEARTDVYGSLLATVGPEGSIRFEFRPIEESDVAPDVLKRFTRELVHDCFAGNRSTAR